MNKNEKAQEQAQAQEFSLAINEQEKTEVERMDDNNNFVVDLTTRTTQYCSMVANTPEEKAVLFNAMNNPANRLGDCINQTIKVKDVFVEVVN